MKILFTGGGTGGHFYPLIAVAEAIREKAQNDRVLPPDLFYMAPSPYNQRALFDNQITYIRVPAGKLRRYFSLLNFTDLFVTFRGIISATIALYRIYPDVVFSKGGYASFPPLVAAKLLRIPVVIHESDSEPGIVSRWSAKFARYIAISYPDAADRFRAKDKKKIALTGNPIRKDIMHPLTNGAHEFLGLEQNVPVILVLGGSQGSRTINDLVIDSLATLLPNYQIIHQTGKALLKEVENTSKVVMAASKVQYPQRYRTFDYLQDLGMRMAAGVADVVISRAGSTIFEIAAWGVPSIIIPLRKEISHDQTTNAFAYARSGACVVMEEINISSTILSSQIERILTTPNIREHMRESAKAFAKNDAAAKIAGAILSIGLEHEK